MTTREASTDEATEDTAPRAATRPTTTADHGGADPCADADRSDGVFGEPGRRWPAAKRGRENVPVASRVLPRRLSAASVAVYDVLRTIEESGDPAPGDRRVHLAKFGRDPGGIRRGEIAHHRVLRGSSPRVRSRALGREPSQRLVRADLIDQSVTNHQRLVQVAEPPAVLQLSERVCAALHLLEHWQDIDEDRRSGRVYLPAEDLDRFGVSTAGMDAAGLSAPLRRLTGFEGARAVSLLSSGAPLVAQLSRLPRVAVAGFVAGGYAAADGLLRTDHEVLGRRAGTLRREVARHLVRLLVRGGRR